MHLRAIDPFTGQSYTVPGSELDRNIASRWSLAAGGDGSLYLAVSAPSGTLVLHVVIDGGVQVMGQLVANGGLAPDVPMAVSDLGLTMVLQAAAGASQVVGVRWSQMTAAKPSTWKNYL